MMPAPPPVPNLSPPSLPSPLDAPVIFASRSAPLFAILSLRACARFLLSSAAASSAILAVLASIWWWWMVTEGKQGAPCSAQLVHSVSL